MITGCLQQKNGYYYALLYLKVDGKRKVKWISTKLPVSETSERKAKKVFDEIRSQYEKAEEERIRREAEEKILAEKYPPGSSIGIFRVHGKVAEQHQVLHRHRHIPKLRQYGQSPDHPLLQTYGD